MHCFWPTHTQYFLSCGELEAWTKHVRQIQPTCRTIWCTLYKKVRFLCRTSRAPSYWTTKIVEGRGTPCSISWCAISGWRWALEEERQANEASRSSLAILVCATKHSSSASVGACALQRSPPTAAGLKAPFPGNSLYLWMASSTNIYQEYAQNKLQVTGKKW